MKEKIRLYFSPAMSFVLLLPLFFVLHGYNENFGIIPVDIAFKLLVIYIVIAFIINAIALLILRHPEKASVFSFFLLFIFFFFGAIHDLLKSFIGSGFLVSYTFLLPFIAVLVVLLFILLRKNSPGNRIIQFLQLTILILVSFEIGVLGWNIINGKDKNNDLAVSPVKVESGKCEHEKPDIYYIVFDGYTSSKCLKEEFGYDNNQLDSLLIQNNFFVSTSSKSNYNVTPFSLASTLNMNYLKPGLEKNIISSRIFMQGIETLKDSWLISFLRSEGYHLKNFGCFDLDGLPADTRPYFAGSYIRQIDNQTLFSRMMKDIGWNFQMKNIITDKFRVPSRYKKVKDYHLFRNKSNYDHLVEELNSNSTRPKFIYAHLMLPHEPFYLDSQGKEVSDTSILLNTINSKQGYLNQVKYANILIQNLVAFVSKPSSRKKVVVIQGDHGYRFYDNKIDRQKEFMNLNAMHFSDGNPASFYDGISPVNTFRVVLNRYFCQELPLLRDSSIYLINNLNVPGIDN